MRDTTKPEFEILNQYIKDLSFETPTSPKIFFEKIEEQPQVEIGLEVKTMKIGEALYENVLEMKVANKVKENAIFIAEISYGAVVGINAE